MPTTEDMNIVIFPQVTRLAAASSRKVRVTPDLEIVVDPGSRVGYSRGYGDIISHEILGAHTKLFRKFKHFLSFFQLYRKYITSS